MKGNPTRTICAFVGYIKTTFFSDLLEAIERKLVGKGYGILLCHSRDNPEIEIDNLKMLYRKHVDGILIATCQAAGKILSAGERNLYSPSIPVVFIDREIVALPGLCIKTDHYGGAYEATAYLCDLGHRMIGLLAGAGISTMRQRIDGYAAALSDKGVRVDDRLISARKGFISVEDAADMTEELIRHQPGITAFFALNSVLVAGAFQVLRRRKKRIPEDVSVIGWDDFPIASAMEPPVTVVAQDIDRIASTATGKVLEMLEGNSIAGQSAFAERQITFTATLIKRASCGCVREYPASGEFSCTGGNVAVV